MNGMGVPLYNVTPKGWTHVDVLVRTLGGSSLFLFLCSSLRLHEPC